MTAARSEASSLAGKRVYVAGHRGMVGAALLDKLRAEDCAELLTASRAEVDLRRQNEVEDWMRDRKPDLVFMAAATVGGIMANDTRPVDFLYDNLMIESNVIRSAFDCGVEKLLFLGSSCIYPRLAPQPIEESSLLTGPLEPTNEWYAIAKIAGVKLCEAYRKQHGADFISAMPTNLYGPGDNYDLASSHVVPALIRKAYEARERGDQSIIIWGTGAPRREFMHVHDCADALIFLMKHYSAGAPINVGVGEDITIGVLAEKICDIAGLTEPVKFDSSKPDGAPRKLMSTKHLSSLGWAPKISLGEGLRETFEDYARARRESST